MTQHNFNEAKKWFENQPNLEFDLILIDWQLGRILIPFFKKNGLPRKLL